jgi:hypothetical protein|tara:strand:+ start:67 stop:489 length:423 start_codon:yes stop_codon:yes gene_type:complete
MRIFLIIIALHISSSVYSQIIGDTFITVKQLIDEPPCEVGRDLLLYCINDKDKIIYSFNSQGHVCQITKFIYTGSYRESQRILEKKLNEFKMEFNLEPFIKDEKYTFFYNDSHSITFNTYSDEKGFFLVEVEFDYGLNLK